MEDARRKRARVEVEPIREEASSPFDSLPDEMLVAIFQHVDSVTRRNVASVCRRWASLLRETSSLHKAVKIDVRILPINTPLHQAQPKMEYWPEEDTLLRNTALFLLQKHLTADTLHIYDSASASTVRVDYRHSEKIDAMSSFLGSFRRGTAGLRIVTIVLQRVQVKLREVMVMLERPACYSSVVLRDVHVVGVAIGNLYVMGYQGEDEELGDGRDRVANCRCVLGASPGPVFLAALAEKEPPLDAREERQYLQVASALQKAQRHDVMPGLAAYIGRGHRPTQDDVPTRYTLNALWKRQVIAGGERAKWLEKMRWEESEPMYPYHLDDDESYFEEPEDAL